MATTPRKLKYQPPFGRDRSVESAEARAKRWAKMDANRKKMISDAIAKETAAKEKAAAEKAKAENTRRKNTAKQYQQKIDDAKARSEARQAKKTATPKPAPEVAAAEGAAAEGAAKKPTMWDKIFGETKDPAKLAKRAEKESSRAAKFKQAQLAQEWEASRKAGTLVKEAKTVGQTLKGAANYVAGGVANPYVKTGLLTRANTLAGAALPLQTAWEMKKEFDNKPVEDFYKRWGVTPENQPTSNIGRMLGEIGIKAASIPSEIIPSLVGVFNEDWGNNIRDFAFADRSGKKTSAPPITKKTTTPPTAAPPPVTPETKAAVEQAIRQQVSGTNTGINDITRLPDSNTFFGVGTRSAADDLKEQETAYRAEIRNLAPSQAERNAAFAMRTGSGAFNMDNYALEDRIADRDKAIALALGPSTSGMGAGFSEGEINYGTGSAGGTGGRAGSGRAGSGRNNPYITANTVVDSQFDRDQAQLKNANESQKAAAEISGVAPVEAARISNMLPPGSENWTSDRIASYMAAVNGVNQRVRPKIGMGPMAFQSYDDVDTVRRGILDSRTPVKQIGASLGDTWRDEGVGEFFRQGANKINPFVNDNIALTGPDHTRTGYYINADTNDPELDQHMQTLGTFFPPPPPPPRR